MRNLLVIIAVFCSLISFSQNTRQTSDYRIFEASDIRQNIEADSFVFFTSPLRPNEYSQIFNLKDHVLCFFDFHLDVYFKKDKYWKIFTMSDGYIPLNKFEKHWQEYHDYFAITDDYNLDYFLDSTKKVNIFNVRTSELSTLTVPEYLEKRKLWNPAILTEYPDSWYTEPYNYHYIRYRNKENGQSLTLSAYHQVDYAYFLMESSKTGYTVMANQNSVRVSKDEKETYDLFPFALRPEINIQHICLNDNKLCIVYDTILEYYNLTTSDLIKRLPVDYNIEHAIVISKDLFYSRQNVLYHYDLEEQAMVDTLIFSSYIGGLFEKDNNLIIGNIDGFSVYNCKKLNIQHYLDNNLISNEDEIGDYDFAPYKILGPELAIVTAWDSQTNRKKSKLLKLNFEPFAVDTLRIPLKLDSLIQASARFKFENGRLIVISGKEFFIFELTHSAPQEFRQVYSYSLPLRNVEYNQPNVFEEINNEPFGEEIMNVSCAGSTIWLSTGEGLFSFTKQSGHKSHFLPQASLRAGTEMIITDEAIYSTGHGNSGYSWPWSKIDRKNYQLSCYSDNQSRAYAGSFRNKGSEIIYGTKKGLYRIDPDTKKGNLIETSGPVHVTAFYGDKYLIAGSKSISIIDKNGRTENLVTYDAASEYSNEQNRTIILEPDGSGVWFAFQNQYHPDLLANYDTVSKKLKNFLLDSYPCRIIPGQDCTIIITHKKLCSYDHKKGVMKVIGEFKDDIYISDAIKYQGKLFITSSRGVYRIDPLTMKSDLCYLKLGHYSPGIIQQHDSMFFLSIGGDLAQYHEKYFQGLFRHEDDPFLQLKKCQMLVLPYNYDANIYIGNEYDMIRLSFDLKSDLAKLKDMPLNDAKVEFFLGNKKIIQFGQYPFNFLLTLNALSVDLETGEIPAGNNELQLRYSVTGSDKIILKSWQVWKAF
jgi:hypothetical protein